MSPCTLWIFSVISSQPHFEERSERLNDLTGVPQLGRYGQHWLDALTLFPSLSQEQAFLPALRFMGCGTESCQASDLQPEMARATRMFLFSCSCWPDTEQLVGASKTQVRACLGR